MFDIQEAKDDLLKAATYLAQKITSSEGRSEAITQIVPFYLEMNQIETAVELANKIIDPFVKDQILLRIAEKCASMDKDNYALELSQMIEDDSLYLQALEQIAFQKIKLGQVEKAMQIAEMLSHPDSIYSALVSYLAEKGKNKQQISEIINKICFPTIKAFSLQNVSLIFAKNDKEKAIEFLEKALEAAFEIDYKIDEIKILIDIAEAFHVLQLTDKAIETLEKAKREAEKLDDLDRENLLSSISVAFLKNGSIELADEALDFIEDKTLIASTLVGFSDVFLKNQENTEAAEALEEALQILRSQTESEIRSTLMRNHALTLVAVRFANLTEIEKAILAAETINDDQEQKAAFSEMAKVLALRQEDELAEQITKMIPYELNRAETFINLFDIKTSLGQSEKATRFLKLAADSVDFIPQHSLQVRACCDLAERFIECGEIEEGIKFAKQALQMSLKMRNEALRVVCLGYVANVYRKNNLTLSEEEKNLLYEILFRAETST
ncbi:MAG: hypothetical protein RML33_10855 [Acidobacteriota bacterium]|nr:hypothetical protein [Pyrinomonadaceae bacterium]MDW8305319.1 hypothetical protein [Acidobacteriota bacterium]